LPVGTKAISNGVLEGPRNTLGGVIQLIEEVLDDYETTRPTTALTDEARAKRAAVEHSHP